MKFLRQLTRIANYAIAASVLAGYLVMAGWYGWFPSPIVVWVDSAFRTTMERFGVPWYFDILADGPEFETRDADRLQPGLLLVVGVGADRKNFIKVIDRNGTELQSWNPDWFEHFTDPEGVAASRIPNSQPGAPVHGAVVTADGELVFNFEKLSTMRLDACGAAVWKLLNQGHHSIHQDRAGNFWVPVATERDGLHPDFRNIGGPHEEDFIQRIGAQGQVLMEKSLFEVMRENGLHGLLYLSTNRNAETLVAGDILHANDIEVFEGDNEGAVVRRGDILVSLRNISTILLLDPVDFRVKAHLTGNFLRQHDPDFIGGDRILIYDNNNLFPTRRSNDPGSRILIADLATGETETFFEGSGETAFFSSIMGKTQLLENGNLMVTASKEARAFEVSPDGEMLWQMRNLIGGGRGAILTSVDVLPAHMDDAFFAAARARCAS